MIKFFLVSIAASAMLSGSPEAPSLRFHTKTSYYEMLDVPGFPGWHCVEVEGGFAGSTPALSCFYDINHAVGTK